MGFKEMEWAAVGSINLAPGGDSREAGNERTDSKSCCEFIEYMSHYWLLRKDSILSTPWRELYTAV